MNNKYLFSLLGLFLFNHSNATEQKLPLLNLPDPAFNVAANKMTFKALKDFADTSQEARQKVINYFKYRERILKTITCPKKLTLQFPLHFDYGLESFREPVRRIEEKHGGPDETPYSVVTINGINWAAELVGLFPDRGINKLRTFDLKEEKIEKPTNVNPAEGLFLFKFCLYAETDKPENKLSLFIDDEFMLIDPPRSLTEFTP